ncbi:hypothetical protein ACEQ8H_003144 [Pleosporales sp. CAS-2024a]
MHCSMFLATLALLPSVFSFPAPLTAPLAPPPHDDCGDASTKSTCDLSSIVQPASALQPPVAGAKLVLIALGQGTQNYTCGTNLTAAPAAIGAKARLLDASCLVAKTPGVSTIQLGIIEESTNAKAIGAHFFVDNTTPEFDIAGIGNTEVKKAQDTPAPNPTRDVKWLRLTAQTQGTTSNVKEIYRINTVGGLAPPNCLGRKAGDVVTVPYEAQYWVYA